MNKVLIATYKYLVKHNILVGVPNLLDIARGKISGARQAQIEGYRKNIPLGAHDVCELGVAQIPFPSLSGELMRVKSDSNNDTLLGSGTRKVTIEYIEPVTETLEQIEIEMNGQTYVNIPVPIAFVSDFYASDGASLDTSSDGDITIESQAGGTIYNVIKEGANKSLSLFRYVPKNKDFYITSFVVGGNSKSISVRLRVNQTDNLTTTKGFLFRSIAVSTDGMIAIPFDPPLVITGGHYLKASLFNTDKNDNKGVVAVGINGHLENKNPRSLN